jgi:large subunit ribosomal protein L21
LNRSGPTRGNHDGIPPAGVILKIEFMYAIVEIAGQQFRVEKDKKIFVQLLDAKEGDTVKFAKVLLIGNDSDITVGTPAVEGANVTAKVLEHVKGDKVLVFKKKRRKGYRKLNGHRQQYTRIQIDNIEG